MLGLVGTNGIGKSTALKVLAGKLKPNLGRFEVPLPSNCEICLILESDLKTSLSNGWGGWSMQLQPTSGQSVLRAMH